MHNRIGTHLCKLTKRKNLQKVVDKQARRCYHVVTGKGNTQNALPNTPKKNKKKVLTSKTRCGKLKTIQEGTQKQSIKRK